MTSRGGTGGIFDLSGMHHLDATRRPGMIVVVCQNGGFTQASIYW